jgi:hypothetical protein
MNRLHCPQCQSDDVEFYEGLLGYEAVRCNACNQETDLNNPESHCERTDRVPHVETTLPDLCHHAEYRIYVNGQYAESVGNIGRNAQRSFEFYRGRNRGKFVEVNKLPCPVPNCTWRQS